MAKKDAPESKTKYTYEFEHNGKIVGSSETMTKEEFEVAMNLWNLRAMRIFYSGQGIEVSCPWLDEPDRRNVAERLIR